jgi:hypothetical protein
VSSQASLIVQKAPYFCDFHILSQGDEAEYVEEACFYLSELRKPIKEIASELNLTEAQVEYAIRGYRDKMEKGMLVYDPETKEFWGKLQKEGGGDERVTLVDDKGRYYHGWKSEMEKMTTEQLMELLITNKRYSDAHPLSEFSKTQPAVGYDPIVPLRNIRRAVSIIEELLLRRDRQDLAT